MYEVHLHRLICHDDEDRRGDECRLEVHVDGQLDGVYRNDMDDGDVWDLDMRFVYQNDCTVILFDEETIVADNRLGVVPLSATVGAERRTAELVEDEDAHYTLEFTVADVNSSRPQAAQRALADWRTRGGAGRWRDITKDEAIASVRTRLSDPLKINQRSAALCGPIAVMYELARLQPERYVRICRELFETGKIEFIDETVDAPQGLLDDDVGRKMDPIDWMLAATIRNEANWLFRVRSTTFNNASGYTLSGAMVTWGHGLLGSTEVHDHSAERGGELEAIRAAHTAYQAGGSAFLQIESSVLEDTPTVGSAILYDHWAVYAGGLSESGGNVSFTAVTWGAPVSVTLSVADFETVFHGAVTAAGKPRHLAGELLDLDIDLTTTILKDLPLIRAPFIFAPQQ